MLTSIHFAPFRDNFGPCGRVGAKRQRGLRPGHASAIRTAYHKLIFFYGLPLDANGAVKKTTTPDWELYNLLRDSQETKNLYSDPDYAMVAARRRDQLQQLKVEVGDTDDRFSKLIAIRTKHWP
jgi:N-acetylglucosamine-6-sulfatase